MAALPSRGFGERRSPPKLAPNRLASPDLAATRSPSGRGSLRLQGSVPPQREERRRARVKQSQETGRVLKGASPELPSRRVSRKTTVGIHHDILSASPLAGHVVRYAARSSSGPVRRRRLGGRLDRRHRRRHAGHLGSGRRSPLLRAGSAQERPGARRLESPDSMGTSCPSPAAPSSGSLNGPVVVLGLHHRRDIP